MEQALTPGRDVRQYIRPPSNGPSSSLTALLSASRYIPSDPLEPDSHSRSNMRSQGSQPQLLGGLLLLQDSTGEEYQGAPTPTVTPPQAPSLSELQYQKDPTPRKGKVRTPGKRPGRPPKNIDVNMDEDSKDRRRRQVRLAQRAYRLRGTAHVESLEDRITELESTVRNMSEAVISFGDCVAQSGLLSSHESLAKELRQLLQTCVTSTTNAGSTDDQETFNSPQHEEAVPPTPPPSLSNLTPAINNIVHLPLPGEPTPLERYGLFYPQCSSSPSAFNFSHKGFVGIATFAEQVRLACVYNAFLMLTNLSIPLNLLRGPCHFLLSLMNRESMISLFKSSYESRMFLRKPEKFYEFPFFQLGGAGTHYSRNSEQGSAPRRSEPQTEQSPTTGVPLSSLYLGMYQELDGQWFDIQDLVGYLREKNARLFLSRPGDSELKSSPYVVNAISLLGALVSRAVCLGRSPGFRRSDVEKALIRATWR